MNVIVSVMAYFHGNSTPLGAGSVILPGNWGRIIRNLGWTHPFALREALFEHVRQTEFPNAVSRLECAYFFDNEPDAERYRAEPSHIQTMLLYEVELVDPQARQFATDYRRVNPHGPVDTEWVRAYWRGEMLPPEGALSYREILSVTPLRVVRRLS